MSLGSNISYLRKQKKLTQEQFAERMNVTRQTVSRWESDEVIPELAKLVDMCSIFSCKLDALVREELSAHAYKLIMEYLKANNFRENPHEKDNVTYMDVYVHVDGVTKVDAYSQFN
ncbi:MAG: helix-turn-helix transcriptional regulator [Agathobacter sp.]|nr:helix-turn-helix transcriptional regulator [Agathobacter sp.]